MLACLQCSQPPLLSHMVAAVYDNTGDMAFLQSAFSALQLEHKYWTSPPKRLRVTDARQRTPAVHSLARYYAETTEPRPEGYRSVGSIWVLPGAAHACRLCSSTSAPYADKAPEGLCNSHMTQHFCLSTH